MARMELGTYNSTTGEAFDPRGASLGHFSNSEEARAAMEAARLPVSFWHQQRVPAIPLLRELNSWVIRNNEKRLPKWKFRFATDLAIQIHSRLTRAYDILFECVALRTEDVSVQLLLDRDALRERHYWRVAFKLSADEPNAAEWWFKPTSTSRGRGCLSSGYLELRQRIFETLHPERFSELTPGLMLSPHCLCCGKGLTDPASMARWIGPECWGSASTNLPRIFDAKAA